MEQFQMLAVVLMTPMGVAITAQCAGFAIQHIREEDGKYSDWVSAAMCIGAGGFMVFLGVKSVLDLSQENGQTDSAPLMITVMLTATIISSYAALRWPCKLDASIKALMETPDSNAVARRHSKLKASAEARKRARAAWKSYVDSMVACDALAEQAKPFSAVAKARKIVADFDTTMPATLKTEEAVHAHPFAQAVIAYEQTQERAWLKTHGKRERTIKKLNTVPRTTLKAPLRRQTKKKES